MLIDRGVHKIGSIRERGLHPGVGAWTNSDVPSVNRLLIHPKTGKAATMLLLI